MRKIDLFLLLKNRRVHRDSFSRKTRALARPISTAILAISTLFLITLMLIGAITYVQISTDLPSLEILPVLLNAENGELLEPTRILDRSSVAILFTLENPGIKREFLSVNPDEPSHFSPQLIRAVVNELDPTFWKNSGTSLKDLRNPSPSTIAERLINDLVLWDEPDSAIRPLRMRFLAAQVVARYGRTQVLEWYLNSAYFGHHAYGAESAARLYFEKSALDLTLAESAILAILIDSPALNPLDALNNSLELQRQFLATLAQNQVITTDEFSSALRQELNLRTEMDEPISLAPAFTRRLIQQLEIVFGKNRLERGGLIIQSSLDLDLQTQFVCTAQVQMIRQQGESLSGFSYDEQKCQAALLLPTQIFKGIDINTLSTAGLILNPQNGEVLVYAGPSNYKGTEIPDAGYQPGSLISPLIGLAGFARGFSPASLKWDIPVDSSGAMSSVQNPDGKFHGPVNMRTAIANDYLIPAIELAQQIGITNINNLTTALGFDSSTNLSDPGSALFSGAETSLLEVGTAYSTLANSGIRSGVVVDALQTIKPNFTLRVETTTNRVILDRSTPDSRTVVSEPLSFLINHVLSDESARWPSLGYPNPLEIGQTSAAKIGQIGSKNQIWTVGYTPQRLVLVWMGNPKSAPSSQGLDPQMAAGIYHALIKMAVGSLPNPGWRQPAGITQVRICVPSGMLPSVICPNVMDEIFLSGNEPSIVDTLYQQIKINRETGQRATVFSPPELIEERIFINVPINARQWAIDAGLAVAPSGYDSIPATSKNPNVMITEPVLFSPIHGIVAIRGTALSEKFDSFTIQMGEGIIPTSWQQIGDKGMLPANNGLLTTWDTSNLNGLYALRLNVIGSDQSIQSSIIQVTVDNNPPQIHFSYPQRDQTIENIKGSVTLSAEVLDDIGIAKVEWWVDNKLHLTQTNSPFSDIITGGKGKHSLQLRAWDTAGNMTLSEIIQFSISP
ncbi:MAG: transglycosylase domain-containing protein [Chloroflexi bacterium]|nr:transglycosylase domain-containing protein [Chloroflexota bacterium]